MGNEKNSTLAKPLESSSLTDEENKEVECKVSKMEGEMENLKTSMVINV